VFWSFFIGEVKMDSQTALDLFRKTGALLDGHFVLTSGLHSPNYFQCARVLQYPWYAEQLCTVIADHFQSAKIDVVASPAVGGIVVGQEVARLLGCRAVFAERVDGRMVLRRGFEFDKGDKVLCVEDVVTTGGSIGEIIDLARTIAEVAGVACIVDRSGGKAEFPLPFFAVLRMNIETYNPADCPLCKRGIPAYKPVSRNLQK
jgi:orotate phosphoribosyltransferase